MGENELKSAIKINEIRLTAVMGTVLFSLYGMYLHVKDDFDISLVLGLLVLILIFLGIHIEDLILKFARQIDELEKNNEVIQSAE